MMSIGVMTGDGELIVFHVEKEIKDDEIEEWISNEMGLSPENFNWQVLNKLSDGDLAIRHYVIER